MRLGTGKIRRTESGDDVPGLKKAAYPKSGPSCIGAWLCIVVKVMVAESGPHAAVRQGVTSRSASVMVPVAVSMLKLPLRSEAVKVPIASKVVTVSALAELRPTTNKVMTSSKGSVAAPSQYVVLM
jgi:hypothetical protein